MILWDPLDPGACSARNIARALDADGIYGGVDEARGGRTAGRRNITAVREAEGGTRGMNEETVLEDKETMIAEVRIKFGGSYIGRLADFNQGPIWRRSPME